MLVYTSIIWGQIAVTTNGSSGLASSYSSLAAAITALNAATITDPVIIYCSAGGTETFASPTAGNITATGTVTNTLTIQKSGSGANPLVNAATGTSTTLDAIIKITGGDYITIDGIDVQENNVNTNTTTQMEFGYYIANASATNGAQYNTIKNCKITLNRTNTSTKAIYQNVATTPTNASGANSYNKYQYITVENTFNGIYIMGNLTYNDFNLEISNCTVGANAANDIGNGSASQINGIRTAYSNNISVFNNEIRNITITSGGQTLFGIYLYSLWGSANFVYNNKIHDLQTLSTNVLSITWGIRADIQSGAICNIYNNMIYALQHGIFTPTSTMIINGIGVCLNGTGTGNVFYNSVSINEDEFPSCTAINIGTLGTINIKNNVFANYSTSGTTSLRYCIYKQSGSTLNSVNNNDYYINTSGTNNYVGSYNSSNQNTLTNWQTVTLKDAASLNINPLFVSATDLHSSSPDLDEAGVTISTINGDALNITNDIDGDIRNASIPDIGADEFSIAPLNLCTGTPGSSAINGATAVCAGNSTLLSLNNPYYFIGIKYQWKSSSVSGGPYSNLDTLITQSTGNLTSPKYFICVISCINSGLSYTTSEKMVSVTTPPSATITYTASPYCKTVTTAQAVTLSGTSGGIFTALPTGLTLNPTTGFITPGSSNAGSYTVTYKIDSAGGCAAYSTTANVIITTAPSATISYAGSPFCKTLSAAQSVSLNGTSGGTYSALPSGLTINATTGAITPGSSTAGSYTVTYLIAASSGCAAVSTNTSVAVTSLPTATISYTGSPYCNNVTTTQNAILTGTSGGTYAALPLGLTINATTGAIIPVTSNPGSYTVSYTIPATGGCAAVSATTQVGVLPLPAAAGTIFSLQNDSVFIGETNVLYKVQAIANATTYFWSYSGTGVTFIPAAITITDSVRINFSVTATSGNLTVKGHNACGDGLQSATYHIYVSPVGINEITNVFDYNIYPNPSTGILTIDINKLNSDLDFQIVNLQGSVIRKEFICKNDKNYSFSTDLSIYPKGIYFIRFINKNFTKVEKVILQ